MPHTRPLECPACGHERVARRPPTLRAEAGSRSLGQVEWTCQLCSYTWAERRAPVTEPVWGVE